MLVNDERTVEQFQATYGLPQVDKVKTRQNVKLLFTVYRQYKGSLEFGKELHLKPIPELQQYQDCDDPSTRRAINKRSSGLKPPNERDIMMRDFMQDIERRVNRLKAEHQEIIKAKFMGEDDELTDTEVLDELDLRGIYMSEATYKRQKASAILKVAKALQITAFVK